MELCIAGRTWEFLIPARRAAVSRVVSCFLSWCLSAQPASLLIPINPDIAGGGIRAGAVVVSVLARCHNLSLLYEVSKLHIEQNDPP